MPTGLLYNLGRKLIVPGRPMPKGHRGVKARGGMPRIGTPNLWPRPDFPEATAIELTQKALRSIFLKPLPSFPEIPNGIIKTLNGNHAATEAVGQVFQVYGNGYIVFFPITPQTEAMHKVMEMVNNGEIPATAEAAPSEHTAMTMAIAAALCGAPVFIATSSVGQAHMYEMLVWAAANRVPMVILLVNRSFSPLNIWHGVADRDSLEHHGFVQLVSSNHQHVYRDTLLAWQIANQIGMPVIVNSAGFIISHTSAPVRTLPLEDVAEFLTPWTPSLDISTEPSSIGTLCSPIAFPLQRGQLHAAYQSVVDAKIYENVRARYNRFSGETITAPFETYRTEDAEAIFVHAGFLTGDLANYVDGIRKERGIKVGLISITMFRPFDYQKFAETLAEKAPKVKILGVIEENLNPGRPVIYRDLITALHENRHLFNELPNVNAFLCEGGQHPNLSIINAIMHIMRRVAQTGQVETPIYRLDERTEGPQVMLNINPKVEKEIFGNQISVEFLGVGGEGGIGAASQLVEIFNERFAASKTVEVVVTDEKGMTKRTAIGSSQYGSEKKLTPTFAKSDASDKPSRSVKNQGGRDVIITSKLSLIKQHNIESLKEDGLLIVNSALPASAVRQQLGLPASVRVRTIDASSIAKNTLGKNYPFGSLVAYLAIVHPEIITLADWRDKVSSAFSAKGAKVVAKNLAAIEQAAIYSQHSRIMDLFKGASKSAKQAKNFTLSSGAITEYPSFVFRIEEGLQIVNSEASSFLKTQVVLSEDLIDLVALVQASAHRADPMRSLFRRGTPLNPDDGYSRHAHRETLIVNTSKSAEDMRREREVPPYVKIITIDADSIATEREGGSKSLFFQSPADVMLAVAAFERRDLFSKENTARHLGIPAIEQTYLFEKIVRPTITISQADRREG